MNRKFYLMLLLPMFFQTSVLKAQKIPSPKEFFGFNIGDDYQLTNYTQAEAYFKKLAASPRTKLVDIGLTEEGRHQYMLIVSSPENIKKLSRYKEISQKLAHADELNDVQAKTLASEGKAVIWIDGGLHATEVVGAHQLIETMYQLVTRTDEETMNILKNDVILMAHANPDGQELVSNWYMREKDPKARKMDVPRLWQKYVGHDNNRDFYMMNMKESQNISKQLFVEWIPQIMYNHHQRGPAGSVLAGPPYRDPFNYVFDPLIVTSIDAVGAAMNNRLNVEGKPGYTQRAGSQFSTWWNGGLRTTPYFHNMVGLLTEIIGNPTPETVALVPDRLIPNGATPNPIVPQSVWHFRQSIDYSVSLNYAVLDYAARYRTELLYNIYKMGKNAINRGDEDHWTFYPKYIDSIKTAYNRDKNAAKKDSNARSAEFSFGREESIPSKYYDQILKNPVNRDARGYVIPADQTDFPTAVKFINALLYSGIQVQKATADFTIGSKKYPAGSYIVKNDQAFRPHVMDMFEPQDHPNDFQYEGGPPIRPYDSAGWTLAFQMGVKFDRIMDAFNGPFQKVPYGQIQSPSKQNLTAAKAGYLLSPSINNSFVAVNDLLKAGVPVYRLPKASAQIAAGTFFVPASTQAQNILVKEASDLGLKVMDAAQKPADAVQVSPMRIGIWNNYGGSMSSGWTRWLMEQYHYNYQQIYPQEIDAGNLNQKFDVLIFVSGAIPALGRGEAPAGEGGGRQPKADSIPTEYRSWLGRITAEKSIPQLKKFMEAGGTIVTVGTSTNLAYHLGLPVHNYLTETGPNGKERPLPGTKYYIPGSLLKASFDTSEPANYGMTAEADVNFDRSPVFKLDADAAAKGVKRLAWFATDKPLDSGWAFGQKYLKDGTAAFVASVGKGKMYAFGPEITFRAQAQNTFRLLFNQLYISK